MFGDFPLYNTPKTLFFWRASRAEFLLDRKFGPIWLFLGVGVFFLQNLDKNFVGVFVRGFFKISLVVVRAAEASGDIIQLIDPLLAETNLTGLGV